MTPATLSQHASSPSTSELHSAAQRTIAGWSRGASSLIRSIPTTHPEAVTLMLPRVLLATEPDGSAEYLLTTWRPVSLPGSRLGVTRYAGKYATTREEIETEAGRLLDELFAGEGQGFAMHDKEAAACLLVVLAASRATAQECAEASRVLAMALAARRGIALKPWEIG